MTGRKIKRRPMKGLKFEPVTWAQLGIPESPALSGILSAMEQTGNERLHLCGSLEQMSREYVEEPLAQGWKFAKSYAHKHRAPVYCRPEKSDESISVKLVGHREGWFPGCEDMQTAYSAWAALESEWTKETGLPLLSSPAATGKALLWESLPKDKEYPMLDDDLAKLIRANSPQHRIEKFNNVAHLDWFKAGADEPALFQYDGRWMYAAMCGLDRFPVGEPRRVGGFEPYQPGWHKVAVQIPDDWNHLGLIPILDDRIGWTYPSAAGSIISGWVSEPELTLAIQNGWKIVRHYDGYAFDKGRPLDGWSKKLIDMRAEFQVRAEYVSEEGAFPNPWPYRHAAAAIRQILNHTIGAMHVDGYEREVTVPDDRWKQWRRDNAWWFDQRNAERTAEGWRVTEYVKSESKLDIYMPHWTSTLYSLARARVAQWALKCDPSTLVKIHGDAIYSTSELPFEDNGRLGQLRRKE